MMTAFIFFRNISFLIILTWILASCGKSPSGGGIGVQENLRPNREGNYLISFQPLNSSLAGMTDAKGSIQIKEDHFTVAIDVKNAPALTMHAQNLYFTDFCPDESHDSNFDGYLDHFEVTRALGKVLIPLDDNLSTQEAGIEGKPSSDILGQYTYQKDESLFNILTDLYEPDLDPKDQIRKLFASDYFSLEGKVVMIFGVQEEAYLPGSIRSLGDVSDRASLPIACGKITRTLLGSTETL